MDNFFSLFQVYHYCHLDGRHDSFLCPAHTSFNQKVFVCDWWYNVNCDVSIHFYALNKNLYTVSFDKKCLRVLYILILVMSRHGSKRNLIFLNGQ